MKKTIQEMKTFLLLWLTQSFSGLGSAMTGYALVIWSYTQEGSALMTAFLMVSSYAPYVLLSECDMFVHCQTQGELLCALCAAEHLRGRTERQVEQENHHSGEYWN